MCLWFTQHSDLVFLEMMGMIFFSYFIIKSYFYFSYISLKIPWIIQLYWNFICDSFVFLLFSYLFLRKLLQNFTKAFCKALLQGFSKNSVKIQEGIDEEKSEGFTENMPKKWWRNTKTKVENISKEIREYISKAIAEIDTKVNYLSNCGSNFQDSKILEKFPK